MSIAFSMAFRSPSLGDNFPLFYATGYLPFMMYSDLAGKLGKSLSFSKPLLFYPSVTYLDALIARFLLNSLTHLMVIYVMLFGIITIFDTGNILTYPPILNAICMALALGLGVGVFNCFLLARFSLWERVWGIITRPLFIISAIFYTMESLPSKVRDILWYNPLVHVVGVMRRGVYSTYDATWASPIYVYSISVVLTFLGLVFLARYHRELLNNR